MAEGGETPEEREWFCPQCGVAYQLELAEARAELAAWQAASDPFPEDVLHACVAQDSFMGPFARLILAYRAQRGGQNAQLNEALMGVGQLRAELAAARSAAAAVAEWTHQHGASLCPRGTDTYGEGMRDAKRQVAALLARRAQRGGQNG